MRRLQLSALLWRRLLHWRAYTLNRVCSLAHTGLQIQGHGGLLFMPLTNITLSGLLPNDWRRRRFQLTRTLAGFIGTPITTTMWTNREIRTIPVDRNQNYNPERPRCTVNWKGLATQQQVSGWDCPADNQSGAIISANEIFLRR